jgi:hypothetical protein
MYQVSESTPDEHYFVSVRIDRDMKPKEKSHWVENDIHGIIKCAYGGEEQKSYNNILSLVPF